MSDWEIIWASLAVFGAFCSTYLFWRWRQALGLTFDLLMIQKDLKKEIWALKMQNFVLNQTLNRLKSKENDDDK